MHHPDLSSWKVLPPAREQPADLMVLFRASERESDYDPPVIHPLRIILHAGKDDQPLRDPGPSPRMIIVYVMSAYDIPCQDAIQTELIKYPKTREPTRASLKSNK